MSQLDHTHHRFKIPDNATACTGVEKWQLLKTVLQATNPKKTVSLGLSKNESIETANRELDLFAESIMRDD